MYLSSIKQVVTAARWPFNVNVQSKLAEAFSFSHNFSVLSHEAVNNENVLEVKICELCSFFSD